MTPKTTKTLHVVAALVRASLLPLHTKSKIEREKERQRKIAFEVRAAKRGCDFRKQIALINERK